MHHTVPIHENIIDESHRGVRLHKTGDANDGNREDLNTETEKRKVEGIHRPITKHVLDNQLTSATNHRIG